jgi:pSer/pThr/pTyr-binding forkhead associated (FHA) protein
MAKSLVLLGISGSRVGQQTVVSARQSTLGSAASCDLVLHDRQVLARHAEIRQSLDRWFITPLDGGALVFVNGATVRGQQRVDDGDLVTVGTATFKAAIQEMREVGGAPRR